VLVAPEHRASLLEHFRANDVAAAIHYPTLIPDQRALTDYGRYEIRNKLSRAQRFATGEVSLPIHPFLRDDEVAHVISTCNAWRGA
jgi:dTDP-4-amino-4,6-dideoxygalactose transaminase